MAVHEEGPCVKWVLFMAAGVALAGIECGSPAATTPSQAPYLVLHQFTAGGPDYAPLMQASDGAFYGTTFSSGASGAGAVFKLSADGSSYSLVHTFSGSDGARPAAGLVEGPDGVLYGTTSEGGASEAGTAFKVTTDGLSFSVLHSFTGGALDGGGPFAGLVLGRDGALYGTTNSGGVSGVGTVFRVSTDGQSFNLIRSLDASSGYNAHAGLVQSGDGNLYGTTLYGGASGVGTIFKVSATGRFSVLYSFEKVNGGVSYGGLVQGSDGALYGTTAGGGASGVGTVFKILVDGSSFSLLHTFDSNESTNGTYPEAGLVLGRDGAFYGTTIQGGVVNCHMQGCGTVFRISADGSSFSVLHRFTGGSTDGGTPDASLVQGMDGAFYGTTTAGGVSDGGVAFRVKDTS